MEKSTGRNLESIKKTFEESLNGRIARHKSDLNAEIARLLEALSPAARQAVTQGKLPEALESTLPALAQKPLPHGQIDFTRDMQHGESLRHLDQSFAQAFSLGRYFPANRLNYPTVYCESLEEFFTPWIDELNLSLQARQTELQRLVTETEQRAQRTKGGGIFGVNLPGRGCFLNGWLFAWGSQRTPRQVLLDPDVLRRVLTTAVHEKLGHGFLTAYSTLGEAKSRLGLEQVALAARFGRRPADDPQARLRQDQHQLVFLVSQLLEEGWSTWLETLLVGSDGERRDPRYSLEALAGAIEGLPINLAERKEVHKALITSLAVLFSPEEHPHFEHLHQAVMLIETLGIQLDDYFGSALGQPLRYVVGELLFVQAERHTGPMCLPYLALIAANVDLKLEQISLADLSYLLQRDPRLHPDARLAALSRLTLEQKDQISELAGQAEAVLSLSVPPELKI